MRRLRDSHPQMGADWAEPEPLANRPEVIGTEDIHVRNYDHQWGCDLSLEVVDGDGNVVYVQRYYIQPGQVESEIDVLPAGKYEVRVTLDNCKEESIHCQINSDPEHTIVIEVGNGALSLTEGLNV